MNEHDQTTPPPPADAHPDPLTLLIQRESKPPKPLRWWLQKLFVCNPFYLVSAALLLYGCYRISLDAPFLNLESARLLSNFSSVQLYEILVVFTAIFLARRGLWYDSTLLVGLENLLIFVPFILVSQAAFIDSRLAREISLAGAVMAMLRFGALKQYFTRLNLPGRSLGAGFILLAVNAALPLIYRHFGETKIGVHIDSGPAYEMNEGTWLLILPAVLALVNFLPRTSGAGNLPPQHRWLPTGLFMLWFIVTSVHVYSLDYIYQFDVRPELIAPVAWVLAWTFWLQLAGNSTVWLNRLRQALTILPVFIPWLAISATSHRTFLALTILNLIAGLGICLMEHGHRLARHLLFASGLMFIVGLPPAWVPSVVPGLSQAGCVAVGVVAYLLLCLVRSRNPKLAVLGSLLVGWSVAVLFHNHNDAIHWAFQSGLVFLLLHSLRWDDVAHPGAKIVRMLMALSWVMQSFLWMDSATGRFWMPCVPGLLTLAIYAAAQIWNGKWSQPIVPAAAILVTLAGPCISATDNIRALPAGLLAVIGSFLLFGLGTLAALTRAHWHKPESTPMAGPARPAETNAPTPL